MARKVIQRIEGVLKQIKRIEEELLDVSLDEFEHSLLLQEAVSFSVSQVGERMNKLEELLKDSYPDLPWASARKMRNIIVHDYDHVDFEKVYLTATSDIPILKSELIEIKDDINHTKEKSLHTERLILRPWDDFDAYELYKLAKDPEIGYCCGWKPHSHIRDSFFALHNFLETNETYAICLKDNTPIGSISLHPDSDMVENADECELGYWLGKTYWGNGYVTEAARRIIEHAFNDLKVSKIWAGHFDGNNRSENVLKKLGFVFHHTIEEVEVVQLNEIRKGHVYFLKEIKTST